MNSINDIMLKSRIDKYTEIHMPSEIPSKIFYFCSKFMPAEKKQLEIKKEYLQTSKNK